MSVLYTRWRFGHFRNFFFSQLSKKIASIATFQTSKLKNFQGKKHLVKMKGVMYYATSRFFLRHLVFKIVMKLIKVFKHYLSFQC